MPTITKPIVKSKQHNLSKSVMYANTSHNTVKIITCLCCYMTQSRRLKYIQKLILKTFLAVGYVYNRVVDQCRSRRVAWDVCVR